MNSITRQAMSLALQLPSDEDQARAVVAELRKIVDQYFGSERPGPDLRVVSFLSSDDPPAA